MYHLETLTPEAKRLFPTLEIFTDDFYLAGGTALALHLGHRISVDFDMFSENPIKKTLLAKVEELYSSESIEVLINNSRELTLLVAGVKYSFIHYPFPLLTPLEKNGPIPLLSASEILITKAYTIGRRGSLKDYIDLYTGLRENVCSIENILKDAKEKYADAFTDRLFLEQLLYMEDVENAPISMINGDVPAKEAMRDFFKGEIAKIVL
jgi:predicted nucleotidyltransferase component of viral defense system